MGKLLGKLPSSFTALVLAFQDDQLALFVFHRRDLACQRIDRVVKLINVLLNDGNGKEVLISVKASYLDYSSSFLGRELRSLEEIKDTPRQKEDRYVGDRQ
jgi:hypothetical protein